MQHIYKSYVDYLFSSFACNLKSDKLKKFFFPNILFNLRNLFNFKLFILDNEIIKPKDYTKVSDESYSFQSNKFNYLAKFIGQ